MSITLSGTTGINFFTMPTTAGKHVIFCAC